MARTKTKPAALTRASTDRAVERTGKATDAEILLKADHRKVEKLFKECESASEDSQRKAALARQICQELIIHTKLEEDIFYPACREAGIEDESLNEAQVEHDGAKIMVGDILGGDADQDYFDAKLKVLSAYIKHHVREEEKPRTGIFAKAKKAGLDMEEVGQRLQARQTELTAEAEALAGQPLKTKSLHFQNIQPASQENTTMPRYSNQRDRDNQGRFTGDDDNDNGRGSFRDRYTSARSSQNYGDDDRNGRSSYDDEDHRRGRSQSSRSQANSSRGGNDRERDEQGRFMRDDDNDHGYSSGSRGDYDDDQDDNRSRRSRSGRSSYDDNEQDDNRALRGRSQSSRSQYGLSRGGSDRDRDEQGRYRSDDEDRGYANRSRGADDDEDNDRSTGRSGRGRSNYDYDEDDARPSRGGRSQASSQGSRSSSRSSQSQGGQGHGGWFGDHRGHSQAAKRGWQHRE